MIHDFRTRSTDQRYRSYCNQDPGLSCLDLRHASKSLDVYKSVSSGNCTEHLSNSQDENQQSRLITSFFDYLTIYLVVYLSRLVNYLLSYGELST